MILDSENRQPFFSIGITTYNRPELLKEALQSVLFQSFGDFEIIIGNDFQAETLTGELLGINDPRVRIINHPVNLREVGNMNALMALAHGRYFTWLFDDDLYQPDFLQTAYDCLNETDFPDVLFPAYRILKFSEQFVPDSIRPKYRLALRGDEFLDWYAADSPQVISFVGLFDLARFRNTIGKVEEIIPSVIGLYSEYHLLVKCALLDRIVYMDAPFYVLRCHAGSYSATNLELENHLAAGRELLRRSLEILRLPQLIDNMPDNFMKICVIHIIEFASKARRIEYVRGGFGVGTFCRALVLHWREFKAVRRLYGEQVGSIGIRRSICFYRILIYCQKIIIRFLLVYGIFRRKQAKLMFSGQN